ncbi:MAG: hypothetical protein ACYTDX_10925 [Planctomycetota bacterium]
MIKDRAPSWSQRWKAMILGIVPGAAHVLILDRAGAGTVLFVLFMLGADAAVLGRWVLESSSSADVFAGGVALAAAAWLLSFLDIARLVIFRDYRGRAETRQRLCDEAITAYARDELNISRRALRQCLDMDARDPDVLYWYGVVEARRGKARRARRSFKRCLKYDETRKWAWECGRELERLKSASRPPSPAGG